MMTFNPGDEVKCKKDESVGIFLGYDTSETWTTRQVSRVKWISGKMADGMTYWPAGYPIYTKDISSLHIEMPYDPTQMGDREDDI